MVFSGKQSGAVHYPVRRDVRRTSVQRPTDHTGAGFQSEVLGDRPVACNPAFWNKFCDLEYVFIEIVGRLRLFNTCHPFASVDLAKFTVVLPKHI